MISPDALRDCRRCALRVEHEPVPPELPLTPGLWVVGFRPGPEELLMGRPFADAAGVLLRQCLAEAGWTTGSVSFTYAVKCPRGGPSRPPPRGCVRVCVGAWLAGELTPPGSTVVALGKAAYSAVVEVRPDVLARPDVVRFVTGGRRFYRESVEFFRSLREMT